MPDIGLSRAVWRKSAHSGGNGSCVEVTNLGTAVAVRDSKDPKGPKLIFTAAAWRNFAQNVKTGTHDL
jgi:uncharacterized protein DUF397